MINIGCSSMKLTSKENNYYWFRTCDMNDELNVWKIKSEIISFSKGSKIKYSNGIVEAKYSFLGISYGKKYNNMLDGINEEGLVGGLQFLLEGTSIKKEKEDNSKIDGMEFVSYVLSICKDCNEVIKLAEKMQILNTKYNGVETKATMHYTFTDRSGKNIILEPILDGKFTIYDNTIGVMTNSPTYIEHINNLEWFLANSIELKNGRSDSNLLSIENMKIDDIEILPKHDIKTYLRSNVFPGSYVSYDRFIRLSILKYLNNDGRDYLDKDMLLYGEKLMNSVIVPKTKGYFYYNYLLEDINNIEHSVNGNILYGGGDDYTQYIAMYDIKNLELNIKKEDSLVWQTISLSNIQKGFNIL